MKNLILLNRSGMSPDLTTRQSRSDSLSLVSRQSVLAILLLCLTFGVGNALASNWTGTSTTKAPAGTYKAMVSGEAVVAGDTVIIVSGTSAMSLTQNTNNRGTTSVTVSSSTITLTNNTSVQAMDVKASNTSGRWLLHTADGYLYAPNYSGSSSNNYLKTETTNKDGSGGDWSISYNEVKANGTNRSNIRLNGAIISCYKSGQTAITVYKKAHSVTYNANSGSTTCSDVTLYKSNATVTVCATTPTRSGFTFTGWSANVDLINASTSATITAGTLIAGGATVKMPAKHVVFTAQWAAAGCANYSFHYGATAAGDGKNITDQTVECFTQVSTSTEWQVTDFTIPTTTQYYFVGYKSYFYDSNIGPSGASNAGSERNQFKYLPVANLQGSSCGGTGDSYKHAAAGAYGTLRIYSNYSDKNLYVGFVPAGYQMRIGSGASWSNVQLTQSSTVWTSAVMDIDATLAAKNYYINVWTSASYSANDAGVAINNWTDGNSTISSMKRKTNSGDNWADGVSNGMRGFFRTWVDNCANNGYCHFVPTHRVVFHSNYPGGGGPADTYSVDVSVEETNSSLALASAPSAPSGYTFDGWYDAADGGNKITTARTISAGATANIELYAHWKATVATPEISPSTNTYNNNQTVSITCGTAEASIYYTITTDGSTPADPTESSTLYSGTLTIDHNNTQIKAKAFKSGWNASAVASATYTLTCATPSISLATGTYTSAQDVTITCSTTNATIYYTTDGSTPNSGSTPYSGVIHVDEDMTLTAIAIKDNYNNSATVSATYTMEIAHTVTFSTGAGNDAVSPVTEASFEAGIELPDGPTPACSADGWVFDGWATASCSSTTTAPVLYMPGDTYYPTADITMYAVYRKLTSGTSTATFAAADISNLTAHPVYSLDWRENSSGVELYIDDGQRYTGSPNTWSINKSQWGLIDGHRKIKSVAVTLSGADYKINSVTAYGGGSASLSTSGTSQTISCSGEVTQLKLTATSGYQIRMTTFTVTYYNATFDSNPTCKDVKSISVQTAPTKLTYCAGDMFDPTGLVIRVTYTDDSYENVAYSGHESDFSFTPSTSTALTTGNTSVTITYRSDKSTTQAITVNTAYTITLTGSGTITGGTISADNLTACAGSTITLTATPNTHYTFSSWNVTSGGSPVTVTSNQFTMPSGNVTVNATFAEDSYRTVVFKSNKQALFDDGGSATTFDGTNNWKQKVYLTEKPVWPTDLVAGQACDANSTDFKGWVADGQTWTGKEASVPVGSTLITSASGFAAAASGSGDVVYHAVWANGESSVVEQTASFGFEEASPSSWTITHINQYSDYSATGDYSGKPGDNGSGAILSPVTIQYKTKLSTPISISFKSSKSNTKSNESNWHVQSSSDGSSWSTVTDGTGPTNSELSQGVFSDPFEVDLSSLSNVYIRIEHGGSSPASLLDDIVLTYEAGGTTYSDYLTTCCTEYDINLTNSGTISGAGTFHAEISSATVTQSCSGNTITLVKDICSGYTVGAWTVTYVDGESHTQTVTVTNNQFEMPDYPVTVSLATTAKTDHFIDRLHNTTNYTGDGYAVSGCNQTVPSLSNASAPSDETCIATHYKFAGWVESSCFNSNGTVNTSAPGYEIIAGGTTSWNASDKTYYAVWAEIK